ncbi:hypothetical protein TresaDRAFT_2432 [Treponema saccharophilum DSM 2985]|uniref:Uncharacterized protein n=1 Tax=Treponema saccharophilum DSM 2985 TaxID=907348 RepID=H7EIM6_9SPIR|nr:hypothetical protein TresaDRAFT_2432 [Treponema saccharophilum DSM 2985]
MRLLWLSAFSVRLDGSKRSPVALRNSPRTHHGGTRTSACRRTLAPTMPILERKTGCKHPKGSCCENPISTPQNSPRRYAHPRVPAHACSDDAEFGMKDGTANTQKVRVAKNQISAPQNSPRRYAHQRVPAHACSDDAEFGTKDRVANTQKVRVAKNLISMPQNSPRRYAHPRVPAHACSDDADFRTQGGLQARIFFALSKIPLYNRRVRSRMK